MMPVILDPGWIATEQMPASTGTKLTERPRYFRGRSSKALFFRSAEGDLYEVRALPACQWPEALRWDGDKQMACGYPDVGPKKSAALRHKRYRARQAALRQTASPELAAPPAAAPPGQEASNA